MKIDKPSSTVIGIRLWVCCMLSIVIGWKLESVTIVVCSLIGILVLTPLIGSMSTKAKEEAKRKERLRKFKGE